MRKDQERNKFGSGVHLPWLIID